jgi:hypothetical protein
MLLPVERPTQSTESEVFIGCCEMETDTWACGTCDTLIGTHITPNPHNLDHTEYRYVCAPCAQKFGEGGR